MATTTSTSQCSCLSNCVDISEAQELMQEIIEDLLCIKDELQLQAIGTCDQTVRACKIKATMVRLEAIDSRLYSIHNSIQVEPVDDNEELVSNFSVSVKLDMAQSKLYGLQQKHSSLRKEWHSQNEHLNKLLKKISDKETELRNQSVFCTAQGLVLSKMLWKLSDTDALLDEIVLQEKAILELVKVFGGCLYGFVRTYGDEMPEPSADEYQYVLCLCGILCNLATVPDGRFLLISQSICRQVYDEMIRMLPKILVPKAENLKWVMLSAIYNLMICKEGENYARNNNNLLQSLAECLKTPNPQRIIILALKIISSLTNDASNQQYLEHVSGILPIRRLEELQRSRDSCVIRKQAKHILGSLMSAPKCSSIAIKEKLIGVTHLDQTESGCQAGCVKSTSKLPNQKLMTYYVLTNPGVKFSEFYHNASSMESSSDNSSLTTISFSRDTDPNFECSSLSQLANLQQGPVVHSAPTSVHHWRSFVSFPPLCPVPDFSFRQFVEQATATANQNINESSSQSSTTDTAKPAPQPTSDHIQCVQYQFPYTNLSKMFTVTMGDNSQNSRNQGNISNIRDGPHTDGESTDTSIVTVYQISNSRAILFNEKSMVPVSAHTQTCNEMSTGTGHSKDTTTSPRISPKLSHTIIAQSEGVYTSDPAYPELDAAYECSWYKNLKSAWQTRTCIQLSSGNEKLLDLPSTSTGLYEFERSCPYVVPIQEQDSTSGPDSSEVSAVSAPQTTNAETSCKILVKKSTPKHAGRKKKAKANKGPVYKIFSYKKRR